MIKKILSITALILIIYVSPAICATVSNVIAFNPATAWKSGSGTASVIQIPTRYNAVMSTGTGTITKWGTAALPLLFSNPLIGLAVSAGFGIGSYYFDQWMNDAGLFHDVDGYYDMTSNPSNLGTVTPTSGHVSYGVQDGTTYRHNYGYYSSSAEALASMNAYANATARFKGTVDDSRAVLVNTSTWGGKWCMTVTGQAGHPKVFYFHFPKSGNPYTLGTGLRSNKTDDEIKALLATHLQQTTTNNDLLKQFLQTHEASMNSYLSSGAVPSGSTLTQAQLDTLKTALLSAPDPSTEYYFSAADFLGAPSVADSTIPPKTVGVSSTPAADDAANAIDQKARDLQADNLAADLIAKDTAVTGINALLPEFDNSIAEVEMDDPWYIDIFTNNELINKVKNTALSVSGGCTQSISVLGGSFDINMCNSESGLIQFGVIVNMFAALGSMLIIFKRG